MRDLAEVFTHQREVDAMLDIAVADDLETEFFSMPPNTRLDLLKEIDCVIEMLLVPDSDCVW